MITLTINNSVSRISGYTVRQEKELRELLSYTVDPKAQYYSGNFRSAKRYLIDKKGNFPTGLLYIVEKYFRDTNIAIIDNRTKPKNQALFDLNLPHTPYEEQVEAAKSCVINSRGIICAPTGVGKSSIIALIINAFQVPTLIVVPSLELKSQLMKTLTEAFGTRKVGGLGYDIAVENVDALDPRITLTGYDCVIIDEFHHSGAKTYRKLNEKTWQNVYYKFGLTATPFRSQDHERLLLESVLSKVIYKIDYNTAVEKKYIVPLEAYYYELPKRKIDVYTWSEVYKVLVVDYEYRNKLIQNLLIKLHVNGLSTLCLVKEIKHGENLTTGSLLFSNGMNEDSRKWIKQFSIGQLKTLIATSGICGEGVDTRAAEYIVIAGLGKSKNAFMQQCGRGFRRYGEKESCKVILFKDPSHKFTLNHFKEQVKILKDEYGITPVRLESL